MTERFIMHGTVSRCELRVARRWISGVGKDAKFAEDSTGWCVSLREWPGSTIYLGHANPEMKVGDRVRLTLEKVKQ